MDGLSAAASILAIIGAATKASKHLGKFSHFLKAKSEVFELITEVSDLRAVLQEIATAIAENDCGSDDTDIRHVTSPEVQRLLSAAEHKLLELNELIEYQLIRETGDAHGKKVARFAWLQQRGRTKRLQQQIKDIRLHLTAVLSARVALQVSQIGAWTRCPSHSSDRPEASRNATNKSGDSEASAAFQTYEKHLALALESFSHQIRQQQDEYRDMLRTIASVHHMAVESRQEMTQIASPSIKSRQQKSIGNDLDRNNFTRLPDDDPQDEQLCRETCTCICYPKRRITTPPQFRSFFGYLMLRYDDLVMESRSCSAHTCRRQSTFQFTFHYAFPTWLLSKIITLHISTHPVFYATVRLPRIVPRSSEIMQCAIRGRTEGIKTLLVQGQASIFDADDEGGWTALHYAVNHGNAEVTKFLLDAGADPFLEDSWKHPRSSIDIAWDHILAQSSDTSQSADFRALFNDTDCLQDRNFSRLHMAVFGLIPYSVESILNDCNTGIDDQDSSGRTALCWAANRGDSSSVQSLIDHNADPNIGNLNGELPLHWAMQSGSPDCVKILVDGKSDIASKNGQQITPLHWASFYQDDITFIEPLIEAGVDLEALDDHRETALMFAAGNDNSNVVAYLLDHGADINTTDALGTTPLAQAVQYNCHSTLRLLLSRSTINFDASCRGNTVLHLAAIKSDLLTIQTLQSVAMTGLDPLALNADGRTAEQLMESRPHASSELKRAFHQLTSRCSRTSKTERQQLRYEKGEPEASDCSDSEVEDVFQDTLEQLPEGVFL